MEPLRITLYRTNSKFSHHVQKVASAFDLTPGQPKILEYLYEVEEADQKTIAKACVIEPATVANVLNRMEEKGLVRRAYHEGNRRSRFISLTPHGKEITGELMKRLAVSDQPICDSLSEPERETLQRLLLKVENALDKEVKQK